VGLGAAGLATSFALLTPPAASVMAEEGEFTLDEVRAHATLETGIWVVHDGNVYDVTAFIAEHPGGSAKIMLAAGGSVEPFWKVYKQHDAPAVRTKLASKRIGALAKADASSLSAALAKDTSDPYCNEPTRHPALRVTKEQPFNAETPVELIADNWITPNELWYCRHHHPVPVVDPATFELVVTVDEPLRPALAFERGAKAASELRLSIDDIKTRFPKRLVTTTLQCAGNRRGELSEHGKTSGLQWTAGTLSTATFGGVYLRDLLAEGLTISEQTARRIGVEHVQFRGIDAPYDASVPVHKALSAEGDVLLAYEMNGEELDRKSTRLNSSHRTRSRMPSSA
jgi:sulfite oxidase